MCRLLYFALVWCLHGGIYQLGLLCCHCVYVCVCFAARFPLNKPTMHFRQHHTARWMTAIMLYSWNGKHTFGTRQQLKTSHKWMLPIDLGASPWQLGTIWNNLFWHSCFLKMMFFCLFEMVHYKTYLALWKQLLLYNTFLWSVLGDSIG